jgi:hypothetical protein
MIDRLARPKVVPDWWSKKGMSEEQRTTLKDPVRTEHRRQIMDGVFNGLIALNGGAAVAVFGFLQVVFNRSNLAAAVLWAIIGLTLGFLFAVFFQILRYSTSYADQFRRWYLPYVNKGQWWAMGLSIVCAVGAVAWLLWNGFSVLSTTPT